jgi:hypothetical protein
MALTMREKQAITRELAGRYRQAGKKARGAILDQVTDMTGYNRCYATLLLRHWGRRIVLPTDAESRPLTLLVGSRACTDKRVKPRIYDEKVVTALKQVWHVAGGICGKRLAPFLEELVPILERHEELVLDEPTRTKLLRISAASIDRALAEEKAACRLKERYGTKPSSSLLHKIPIQTHSEAPADRPGFVEVGWPGAGRVLSDTGCDRPLQRLDRNPSGTQQGTAVGVCGAQGHPAAIAVPSARYPFRLRLGVHQRAAVRVLPE